VPMDNATDHEMVLAEFAFGPALNDSAS